MATVIRGKDKFVDTVYEPPLKIGRGIWSETVENPHLTMSRVVIPPGSRNQRHYHVFTDAGMHILKGKLKMVFGPEYDKKEIIAEAGDFVLVTAGEIHGLMNLSKTEPAEIVACYGGIGHKKQAGTVYLEPPEKEE